MIQYELAYMILLLDIVMGRKVMAIIINDLMVFKEIKILLLKLLIHIKLFYFMYLYSN